jgi:Putative zinc binding domain
MTANGAAQAAMARAAGAELRREVRARTTCRSCGSRRLEEVLSLGNPYISNFADVPDARRWQRVPLELLLCTDCSLLQLRHTSPAEWLYRQYWYKSGVSASMRDARGCRLQTPQRLAGGVDVRRRAELGTRRLPPMSFTGRAVGR